MLLEAEYRTELKNDEIIRICIKSENDFSQTRTKFFKDISSPLRYRRYMGKTVFCKAQNV